MKNRLFGASTQHKIEYAEVEDREGNFNSSRVFHLHNFDAIVRVFYPYTIGSICNGECTPQLANFGNEDDIQNIDIMADQAKNDYDRTMGVFTLGHVVCKPTRKEADDFLIDTHGADIIDPVWQLLDKAYELYGVFPTLLERDFNLPAIPELLQEVQTIKTLQSAHGYNT